MKLYIILHRGLWPVRQRPGQNSHQEGSFPSNGSTILTTAALHLTLTGNYSRAINQGKRAHYPREHSGECQPVLRIKPVSFVKVSGYLRWALS